MTGEISLKAIYIAKNDEYDQCSNLVANTTVQEGSEGFDFLIEQMTVESTLKNLFELGSSVRLPLELIIELANENNRFQQLAVAPPFHNDKDGHFAFMAQHVETFFSLHAFTCNGVSSKGFAFPPGHPVAGTLYRQHPLAAYLPEKQNVYIPSEIFDAILFAERERELNDILVEMGATKIRVANASASKRNKQSGASAGISFKAIGGAVSASSQQDSEQETVEAKQFALTGLAWHHGDRLDRSKYGWLNFEPEWQATVHAREVGQCQSARIELYKRSSFHVETEVSAKLRKHFVGVEISAHRRESGSQEDQRIIEVEFGPTLPPRKKQGWLSRLLG